MVEQILGRQLLPAVHGGLLRRERPLVVAWKGAQENGIKKRTRNRRSHPFVKRATTFLESLGCRRWAFARSIKQRAHAGYVSQRKIAASAGSSATGKSYERAQIGSDF